VKDIGERFKETREFIGIGEEEAAADMEITVAQLENLEDGNANAFKDMFFLKDLIKKYAKYLNLDEDKLMEEYNEFMFNFTSRIPIAEIEKETQKINKEETKGSSSKVISPYTRANSKKKSFKFLVYIFFIVLIITVGIIIFFFLKSKMNSTDFIGISQWR